MEKQEQAMSVSRTFDAAWTASLDAATRGQSPIEGLSELDRIFENAKGVERRKMEERVAGPLLQALRADPDLLATFKSASSRANKPGSKVFLALIEVLALQPDLTEVERLAIVETYRRFGRYQDMQHAARAFEASLATDPRSGEIRRKLDYELAMSCSQRARAAEGEEAALLYEEGLNIARRSAAEAEGAGDLASALHARMIEAGEFLRKLRRTEEAAQLLKKTGDAAKRLAGEASGGEARRLLQVAMNTSLHRGYIIIEQGGDPTGLRDLLGELHENPIFVESLRSDWARDFLDKAQSYLVQP